MVSKNGHMSIYIKQNAWKITLQQAVSFCNNSLIWSILTAGWVDESCYQGALDACWEHPQHADL